MYRNLEGDRFCAWEVHITGDPRLQGEEPIVSRDPESPLAVPLRELQVSHLQWCFRVFWYWVC